MSENWVKEALKKQYEQRISEHPILVEKGLETLLEMGAHKPTEDEITERFQPLVETEIAYLAYGVNRPEADTNFNALGEAVYKIKKGQEPDYGADGGHAEEVVESKVRRAAKEFRLKLEDTLQRHFDDTKSHDRLVNTYRTMEYDMEVGPGYGGFD